MLKKLDNKKLLIESLKTLVSSWGGDTPPEALWALYELAEFIKKEYELEFEIPTEEDYYGGSHCDEFHKKFDDMILIIDTFL